MAAALPRHFPCFAQAEWQEAMPTQVCDTGGCSRTLAVCLWPSWWDLQPQSLVPWLLSRHCLSQTWEWMAGRCNMPSLLYVVADGATVISAGSGCPVLHMAAVHAAYLSNSFCIYLDTRHFMGCSTLLVLHESCLFYLAHMMVQDCVVFPTPFQGARHCTSSVLSTRSAPSRAHVAYVRNDNNSKDQ